MHARCFHKKQDVVASPSLTSTLTRHTNLNPPLVPSPPPPLTDDDLSPPLSPGTSTHKNPLYSTKKKRSKFPQPALSIHSIVFLKSHLKHRATLFVPRGPPRELLTTSWCLWRIESNRDRLRTKFTVVRCSCSTRSSRACRRSQWRKSRLGQGWVPRR